MAEISLIFLPLPVIGHLEPTVEIAKTLLSFDRRLSITFLIIHRPGSDSPITSLTSSVISDCLQFLDVPNEDSESHAGLVLHFIETKKPAVRKMVGELMKCQSPCGPRLAGFVVDMLCTAMIEVAAELGVPSYIFYTCGASYLAVLLHVQKLCDNEGLYVAEFEQSDVEFSLPGFSNKVPTRLLPSLVFYNETGVSATFIGNVRQFRKTKGILVNSFIELESHAVESMRLDPSVPPIYPVGPMVKTDSKSGLTEGGSEAEIMAWLDGHPPESVVFLCFGSRGTFGPDQVKEMALGIESSGCRFLWSLRRPSSSQAKFATPEEYEDFSEVLPEGFLHRTAGVGKVIGWAPQAAVLSHPAVGGFVSHCGWNSILESLWFGVPIATWPLYAEQQINAFEAVREMGIGVEISVDYRTEIGKPKEGVILGAELIERGIRQVMEEESDVRKKVKLMMEKCREAVVEGGSSFIHIQRFIDDLRSNIGLGVETNVVQNSTH